MEALQLELQSILKVRFQSLQNRNPGFSIRAFARELGIGAGTMSDFLNGKRRLSEKLISEIAERIALDPHEKGRLAKLNTLAKASESQEKIERYLVPPEQLHLVTEWYYLAILNLIRLKEFKSEPEWIANRLGLPATLVEEALTKLEAGFFITKDESGSWVRNMHYCRTSEDIPNALIRKSHIDTLRLAQDAMKELPVEERDCAHNTFVMSKKKMQLCKVLVRKFIEEFCTEVALPDDEADEVYRIAVQLFPLTSKEGRD